jgi:hypothetical protein
MESNPRHNSVKGRKYGSTVDTKKEENNFIDSREII